MKKIQQVDVETRFAGWINCQITESGCRCIQLELKVWTLKKIRQVDVETRFAGWINCQITELSGVRLSSVVRRPLDNLHFKLLLQNRLIDFDETWYGWSTQGPLQVLLFYGKIRPAADPGRGQNRSRGVPFFNELLLQTGRLQQQIECIAVI